MNTPTSTSTSTSASTVEEEEARQTKRLLACFAARQTLSDIRAVFSSSTTTSNTASISTSSSLKWSEVKRIVVKWCCMVAVICFDVVWLLLMFLRIDDWRLSFLDEREREEREREKERLDSDAAINTVYYVVLNISTTKATFSFQHKAFFLFLRLCWYYFVVWRRLDQSKRDKERERGSLFLSLVTSLHTHPHPTQKQRDIWTITIHPNIF